MLGSGLTVANWGLYVDALIGIIDSSPTSQGYLQGG